MEAETTALETEALADHAEDTEARATPLELFFDLVFVFAFTQVTGLMSNNPTWEGLGQGMLVLAAVWWTWGGYAWLTNALHSDDGIARFGLMSAMGAMLVAALAIPGVFEDDGLLFGCAFFLVRIIHILVYARGAPEVDVRNAIVGLAPGLLGGPALLIVAGTLDGGAQAGMWIAALALDYGIAYIGDVSGFRVSPSHFAERFGLIVIIALGESIVAIGIGAEGLALDAGEIAAAVVGLALVCALWWAYFDVVALVAERKLREAATRSEQNRLARDSWGVLHGLLIAGIVLVALGLKKTLADVDEPLKTAPAVGLCGGLAIYLLGHVAMRLRSVGTFNRQRTLTAVICLALIPYGTEVDALAALVTATAVMTTLVAYEAIRFRERRAEIRAAR